MYLITNAFVIKQFDCIIERYIPKYTFSTDVNVKFKRLQKCLLKIPLRFQWTKLEIISLKYDGYITNTVGVLMTSAVF